MGCQRVNTIEWLTLSLFSHHFLAYVLYFTVKIFLKYSPFIFFKPNKALMGLTVMALYNFVTIDLTRCRNSIHNVPGKVSSFSCLMLLCSSFPGCAVVKNLLASTGDTRDMCLIPGSGNTPLEYSCLKNSMKREAWWASLWGHKELDTTEHTHSCIRIILIINILSIITWRLSMPKYKEFHKIPLWLFAHNLPLWSL